MFWFSTQKNDVICFAFGYADVLFFSFMFSRCLELLVLFWEKPIFVTSVSAFFVVVLILTFLVAF